MITIIQVELSILLFLFIALIVWGFFNDRF